MFVLGVIFKMKIKNAMKDYSDAACPFSARKVRKVVSKNYLNMAQKLIKSCSNTLLFLLSNQEIAVS